MPVYSISLRGSGLSTQAWLKATRRGRVPSRHGLRAISLLGLGRYPDRPDNSLALCHALGHQPTDLGLGRRSA